MGETLTTGQLLDTLEVGQETVCVEFKNDQCVGWKVQRETIGLTGFDRFGECKHVVLNDAVIRAKWRIVT